MSKEGLWIQTMVALEDDVQYRAVPPGAKVTLQMIALSANEKGVSWIVIPELAFREDRSIRQVERDIALLVKTPFLSVVRKGGKGPRGFNEYTVSTRYSHFGSRKAAKTGKRSQERAQELEKGAERMEEARLQEAE